LRPSAVAIRARKPWVRARLRLLGWKVRFMTATRCLGRKTAEHTGRVRRLSSTARLALPATRRRLAGRPVSRGWVPVEESQRACRTAQQTAGQRPGAAVRGPGSLAAASARPVPRGGIRSGSVGLPPIPMPA
jgi:hypothetical protein